MSAVTSAAPLLDESRPGLTDAAGWSKTATVRAPRLRHRQALSGEERVAVSCEPGPGQRRFTIRLSGDVTAADLSTIVRDLLAAGAWVLSIRGFRVPQLTDQHSPRSRD